MASGNVLYCNNNWAVACGNRSPMKCSAITTSPTHPFHIPYSVEIKPLAWM